MDLSTVLRNIKNHKYKSKADFAADLDLIWENCLLYNTTEVRLHLWTPSQSSLPVSPPASIGAIYEAKDGSSSAVRRRQE